MITCPKEHLAARCRQRGYTLDEVRPCIVSEDGDQITVDETHKAYPREPKPGFVPPVARPVQPPQPPAPTHGPGTELKKLLKRVGITASPTCSCNARARRMDEEEAREPGWCEAHLDEIVGWLREEATKRGLPFVDMAGRVLVKRAISNARKAEARRAKEAQPAESGPA
jgi:hypothetical protein